VPFVAVPSVKLGVTLNPPDTAPSTVTVNLIPSPSLADALPIVRAGASSLRMYPVAVSVPKLASVSETVRPTVKISVASHTLSSMVATVKVCVSFGKPSKVSVGVFAV